MALSAMLIVPVERRVVPEWRVRVLDESGNPVPQVVVHEEWIESPDDQTSVASDTTSQDGLVAFPARNSREPVYWRLLETWQPSAHAFVCWNGKTGDIQKNKMDDWKESRLVLHGGGCGYG